MTIQQIFFDKVLVLEQELTSDTRGTMLKSFSEQDFSSILPDFHIKEQRIYSMPSKGTFFGIHYQSAEVPQAKLITVIQGKGLDYIVDLRRESKTYLQWKRIGLTAENQKFIYIPSGFGHAFLSMEDNTIQIFAADEYFTEGHSKQLNYKDPKINLLVPVESPVLSDYDLNAPFIA